GSVPYHFLMAVTTQLQKSIVDIHVAALFKSRERHGLRARREHFREALLTFLEPDVCLTPLAPLKKERQYQRELEQKESGNTDDANPVPLPERGFSEQDRGSLGQTGLTDFPTAQLSPVELKAVRFDLGNGDLFRPFTTQDAQGQR